MISISPRAMFRTRSAFVTTCILVATFVTPAQAGKYDVADLRALERVFVDLAEEVRPSVAVILTYVSPDGQRDSRGVRRVSQGSGFVFESNGLIGTNYHVIEGADFSEVVLHDGSKYDADVVSVDSRRDLAILRIDEDDLRPVELASVEGLKPNMWTFACGNPFGLANEDGNTSISFGTVTALGRDMTRKLVGNSQVEYYGNLIETSSAINPGNSGGPLFNLDGKMIGVVTAIETSSGVNEGAGFAIPTNDDTLRILRTLAKGEEVRYGFLGVEIGNVQSVTRTVPVAQSVRGVSITNISPSNGPAAQAGLREGDIVLYVDGKPVNDPDELVRVIQFKSVGARVKLTYLRKGVQRKTTVTLGDRATLIQASNDD
ncbi:MAG: S1C family serine protease [Phycisphaerae bacterium]